MNKFDKTNLPPYHQPVLIKLKQKSAPPFGSTSGYRRDHAGGEDTSLLEAGVFYGYAVAVLAFQKDGFGERYPTEFRVVRVRDSGECVGLGDTVKLIDVESWMGLP
jgi:hypothetical protein